MTLQARASRKTFPCCIQSRFFKGKWGERAVGRGKEAPFPSFDSSFRPLSDESEIKNSNCSVCSSPPPRSAFLSFLSSIASADFPDIATRRGRNINPNFTSGDRKEKEENCAKIGQTTDHFNFPQSIPICTGFSMKQIQNEKTIVCMIFASNPAPPPQERRYFLKASLQEQAIYRI